MICTIVVQFDHPRPYARGHDNLEHYHWVRTSSGLCGRALSLGRNIELGLDALRHLMSPTIVSSFYFYFISVMSQFWYPQ